MELIANKYRMLKSLGQGAMGEVFLVLPPHGEPVALKLLKTLDEKAGKNAADQFENEFKVLKKISHPNIAKIYDYGYDETLKKVFFTMPYLKGTDMYQATKDLPFETSEEIFVQSLRALNYLHQKNFIHCDLKPGNIYVEDGKALLIDFGLAGYFGDFIVGTPTYLAPEVFQGSHHTVVSDLYAMGIIFYNCLTRTQPFSGKTLQEVYDNHRTKTLLPIHEINKKVPKYFSDIVATLLNKSPEERFQSASAVIEEIAAFSRRKYSVETEETLLSYLPTQSELVGRKEALLDIQSALGVFLAPENMTPYHVIFIHGRRNIGKNRLVTKIINDLQLAKITLERAVPPFQGGDGDLLMKAKAIVFENVDSYQRSQDERNNFADFTTLIEQKNVSPDTTRFLLVASSVKESDFDPLRKLFPEEATKVTVIELTPYAKDETREFLVSVIGQKEIPQTFVDQFYRNTEGLPGLAQELIQTMIEKGLLFDKSGRWNEDLLAELDKALDHIEVSESLEQDFERTYASLNGGEEDAVNWLSIAPHGLTVNQVRELMGDPRAPAILEGLAGKSIVRQESGLYTLYRKIFEDFVRQNLPDKEVRKRHLRLALPKTGLTQKWAIYHLSLSGSDDLALKAGDKLAKLYEKEGARDLAVEVLLKLIRENPAEPLMRRLGWIIEASTLLIWLDRFNEALAVMEPMEKELQQAKEPIDFERFLTFVEKKGLALLHSHEFDRARVYFLNGLKSAEKDEAHLVHALRFENDLAGIEVQNGNHDKAIEYLRDTRERARGLSPVQMQFITNNDLGHVFLNRQEWDKAIQYLSEDMRIFAGMTNQEPLARALYSYAECLRFMKKNDPAAKSYEECIRICKRGHFLPLLLRSYNGLGNLYNTAQDYAPALTNYQKALDLAVRLNDTSSKAALMINQGYIYRRMNNNPLAQRRYLLTIQVLENMEKKVAYDHFILGKCYGNLAVLTVEDKNPLKALSYCLECLKTASVSGVPPNTLFKMHADLAEMYFNNRLEEQFRQKITEIKTMATNDEQREIIKKLETEWQAISNYDSQDSTGRIGILQQPG